MQVQQPNKNPAQTAEDLLLNISGGGSRQVESPEEVNEEVSEEPSQEEESTQAEGQQVEEEQESTDGEEEVEDEAPESEDLSEWDTDDETPPSEQETSTEEEEEYFDFSRISEAVGEDVEDEEGILQAIEKARTSALDGLPKDLVDAIELAREGGDYKEMLGVSQVDYSKLDARQFVEEEARAFFEGEENADEKLEEYMDSLSDIQVEMRGRQLRKEYQTAQEYRKQQLQESAKQQQLEAERQQKENDKRLLETLKQKEKIEGMPIQEKHRKAMYDLVSNGKLHQKLFYDNEGNLDFNKIINLAFQAEYGEKVKTFKERNIKANTKKEILRESQNVSLRANGSAPKGGASKSGLDVLMSQLRPGN